MAVPDITGYFVQKAALRQRAEEAAADREQAWRQQVLSSVLGNIIQPLIQGAANAGLTYLGHKLDEPMKMALAGGTPEKETFDPERIVEAQRAAQAEVAGLRRQAPEGPTPIPPPGEPPPGIPERVQPAPVFLGGGVTGRGGSGSLPDPLGRSWGTEQESRYGRAPLELAPGKPAPQPPMARRAPAAEQPMAGRMAEGDVLDHRQRPVREPEGAFERRPPEPETARPGAAADAYGGVAIDPRTAPRASAEAAVRAGRLPGEVPAVVDRYGRVVRPAAGGLTPYGRIAEGVRAAAAGRQAKRESDMAHAVIEEEQAAATFRANRVQELQDARRQAVEAFSKAAQVDTWGGPRFLPNLGDPTPALATWLSPEQLASQPPTVQRRVLDGSDAFVTVPADEAIVARYRAMADAAQRKKMAVHAAGASRFSFNLAPIDKRVPPPPGEVWVGEFAVTPTSGRDKTPAQVQYSTADLRTVAREYGKEGGEVAIKASGALLEASRLMLAGDADGARTALATASRLTEGTDRPAWERVQQEAARARGVAGALARTGTSPEDAAAARRAAAAEKARAKDLDQAQKDARTLDTRLAAARKAAASVPDDAATKAVVSQRTKIDPRSGEKAAAVAARMDAEIAKRRAAAAARAEAVVQELTDRHAAAVKRIQDLGGATPPAPAQPQAPQPAPGPRPRRAPEPDTRGTMLDTFRQINALPIAASQKRRMFMAQAKAQGWV